MRLFKLFIITMGLLLSSSAQSPAPVQPTDPLASIYWLTGGTWVAEMKDAQGIVQTRIENRIRRSENGHLIKFVTTFVSHNKPEVHYEGIYAYDPASKRISYWYTGNDGDLTSGYVTADGNTFTHDFDIAHMNGKVDKLRSVIVRDGDNAYNWNVLSQKNGTWAELFHLRYVREKSGD